jgi:putative GTP pyrophosphokinase
MDESEVRSRYDKLRPLYERLLVEVETTLRHELAIEDITPSAILPRIKHVDSLVAKVSRKGYEDPFTENEDFAGLRIVCLFTEEVELVDAIVRRVFAVRSMDDKSAALEVDRMGYEGRHYIVTSRDDWSGPRYTDIKGLPCEIQLRTICQDTWAQIDRHLDYPRSGALDPPTRRELNRMAALLETAQSSFDGVKTKREAYARKVSPSVQSESDFLSQPVDRETVRAYAEWKFPGLPMKDNILQLFLRDLDHAKYLTLRDIDRVVNRAKPFNEYFASVRPERYTSSIDFLTKGFGYIDLAFRAKHPFGPDTKKLLAEFKPQAAGG